MNPTRTIKIRPSATLSRQDTIRYPNLMMAGILLLAFSLWTYNLGEKTLLINEADSVIHAEKTPVQIIKTLYKDQSPLHYILLHYWMEAFGDSEFSVRFPSVLFGVVTVLFTYLFVRRLFGVREALLAAFLVAVSPFFLDYAQRSRMYTMLTFFSLATLYFGYRFVDEGKWWTLPACILFSIANLYTHFFAFPAVACAFGFLVLLSLGRKHWRRAVALVFSAAIVAGGAYLQIIRIEGARKIVKSYGVSWGIKPKVFFHELLTELWVDNGFYSLPERFSDLWLNIFLWGGLGLVCLGFLACRFRHKLLFALWIFPTVAAMFWTAHDSPTATRYVIWFLPVLFAFAARGILCLRWGGFVAPLVLLLGAHFLWIDKDRYGQKNQEWEEAGEYIQTQYKKGDTVIITPGWPIKSFQYYIDKNTKKYNVIRAWRPNQVETKVQPYRRAHLLFSRDRAYRGNRAVPRLLKNSYAEIQAHPVFGIDINTFNLLSPSKTERTNQQRRARGIANRLAQAPGPRIAVLGDLYLDSRVRSAMQANGGGGYLFEYLRPIAEKMDVTLYTLRTPLIGNPQSGPKPEEMARHLNLGPKTIINFAPQGSAANQARQNKQTVETLRNSGCLVLQESDSEPLVIELEGRSVAFLSVPGRAIRSQSSNGRLPIAEATSLWASKVLKAKDQADVVVAVVSWDPDRVMQYTKIQENAAGWLIEQGVDLVVGCGTRTFQDVRKVNDATVAFSLGPLVADPKGLMEIARLRAAGGLIMTLDSGEIGQFDLLSLGVTATGRPHITQGGLRDVQFSPEGHSDLPPGKEVLYAFREHLRDASVSVRDKKTKKEEVSKLWLPRPQKAGDLSLQDRWFWGKRLWQSVAATREVAGHVARNVIWAHPQTGKVVRIQYKDVPIGRSLEGSYGITDFAQLHKSKATVYIKVLINGKKVFEEYRKGVRGWKPFRIDTREWNQSDGNVTFEISCEGNDGRRHFCFTAFSTD